MIIVHELYGLNSSGSAWLAMLVNTLCNLGYQSTRTEPDLWIKLITRLYGRVYYALVLIYFDDILHIHHDTNYL